MEPGKEERIKRVEAWTEVRHSKVGTSGGDHHWKEKELPNMGLKGCVC